MRTVTLVCGPPCAGKNHHISEHAHPDDIVLDYDAIAQELGSPSQWDHPHELLRPTEVEMRRRMEQVGAMTTGTAWVIRTAPRQAQRDRAARITGATDTIVLVPTLDTLRTRAAARSARTLGEIEHWLDIYQSEQQPEPTTFRAGPIRNGSTRAWRKLRAQVLAEEPLCRIRIDGTCTTISTQADHIIPIALRPDLAMVRANIQGACAPCNRYKGSSGITAESSRHAEALAFFGE